MRVTHIVFVLGRSRLRPRQAALAAALAATVLLTGEPAASAAVPGGLVAARHQSRPPGAARTGLQGLRPDRWGPEEIALRPVAALLLARHGNDVTALRNRGTSMLAVGRNEATAADFLQLRATGWLGQGLEHYGALLSAADGAQVAMGVAGVERYSELIHNSLLHGRTGQLIIISLAAQQLTAYDNGTVVVDTPVTTGRPALSTDVGLMHVLRKDSPWTMKSPWPKGSPLWYPDTVVAMVAWFTSTGEGMHDAAWEPASAFGPGSETGPFASHGCVHVPLAAESILFNWVSLGSPVVVIPGDGRPLVQQRLQLSVDAAGNPISGARGE